MLRPGTNWLVRMPHQNAPDLCKQGAQLQQAALTWQRKWPAASVECVGFKVQGLPHLQVLRYGPLGLLGDLVVEVLPPLWRDELLPGSGGIGTLRGEEREREGGSQRERMGDGGTISGAVFF